VLSAATTALTLLAAYPVAYALARTRSRGLRSLIPVLTLAPFFTGAIVGTYAWMLLRGHSFVRWPVRLLFEPSGVLIGLVQFSMPTMILILAAALSHLDPFWERAAASLGARPARVFWRVTWPLSMPGVASGCLVVFAWTLSAFATPELLGGGRVKMIANVVKDLALDAFDWPAGPAFAVVALGLTLGLLVPWGAWSAVPPRGILGRHGGVDRPAPGGAAACLHDAPDRRRGGGVVQSDGHPLVPAGRAVPSLVRRCAHVPAVPLVVERTAGSDRQAAPQGTGVGGTVTA
jgi:putative spermidine/putrescine transport system permease protein